MKAFTLALGGGGVKGLAHIALLKKLDAMGCKPSAIAGTSMGAILGALYASGISGEEIENRVREHLFTRGEGFKQTYRRRKHLVKWLKVFTLERSRGGILTADGLFQHLFSEIVDAQFDTLAIPFTAVAADFHSGEEVALNQGGVLAAVRASMAVPGVFAPVRLNDRLLVDGGAVNNVPCSHVYEAGRTLIASDVISLSTIEDPSTTQVLSGAFSIMLRAATRQHFFHAPPSFIFQPDTSRVDAFDFHKIVEVLARGEDAVDAVSAELEALLS